MSWWRTQSDVRSLEGAFEARTRWPLWTVGPLMVVFGYRFLEAKWLGGQQARLHAGVVDILTWRVRCVRVACMALLLSEHLSACRNGSKHTGFVPADGRVAGADCPGSDSEGVVRGLSCSDN